MVDSNTSGTGSGGTESSLVGGLGGATPPSGGKKRVLNALRVGARVNLEGMRAVVTETTSWLRVLRDVRKELDGINTAAARFPASMGAVSGGGGGGVGASPGVPSPNNLAPYARMQSMTKGFVAITATRAVFSYGTDRFNRNLTESVPLSQHDTLLTSMYSGKSGYQYGTVDRQRLIALGQFGMSRGEAAAAQGIGLGYGQNPTQTNTFLSRTVAPVVQASGGTLTPSGAAQVSAQFLDPLTLRRAQSLNIPMGRIGGQVGNPYTVAQGYIKDFEKRNGNKLNGIDYTNMRSAGSMVRFEMKRMYQLTDEAIDTIIQAGMQNITFQSMPGNGNKNIDFSSSRDLAQVVPTNRLGLTAFKALTASATREANFASKQAGAEVTKLNVDATLEKTLGSVENQFSGLIGPMGEFQKYIKGATVALQGLLVMGGAKALLGGGGGAGLVGGLLGGGGNGVGAATAAAETSGGGGLIGGVGKLMRGGGASLGLRVAGVAVGVAGMQLSSNYAASHGGALGGAVGIAGGAASGALAGASIAGAPGAVIGAVIGGANGAKKWINGMNKRDVTAGRLDASMMSEKDIFNLGIMGAVKGGAGPKETARFDVIQQRRSAMLAAMLQEVSDTTNAFDHLTGKQTGVIKTLIDFGNSGDTAADFKYFMESKAYTDKVATLIKGNAQAKSVYDKYFGGLSTPFDLQPLSNSIATSLISTSKSIISGTGDAVFDHGTGDPISGHSGGTGPTWDKIDARLKGPLSDMLRAAGGKVWLNEGWRSTETQTKEFYRRHHEDPKGNINFAGKTWALNPGEAEAAPPGRSYHEIGLAADLGGDLAWVQTNAAKFGLVTFAGVNNEPWHVQLANMPNSRSEYESGSGVTSAASGTTAAASGGSIMANSGGGGSPSADSGVGFALNSVRPYSGSGGGGGSMVGGTASASTVGALGGSSVTATGPGGSLTSQDVARMAYNAGFRGQDLVNVVAIAKRESNNKAGVFNGNTGTGDQSYGLMQINMLGAMGPSRLKQFGLSDPKQLLDPQTNLNAAFKMYSSSGNSLGAWGGYKGKSNTFNTQLGDAAAAVSAAGLTGDGPFNRGGGGYHFNPVTHVNVSLQSSGNLQYDVEMLAQAAADKVNQKLATATRRGS